jgi:voltage-gated potassium channel
MKLAPRLFTAIAALAALTALGTAGYMLIEGMRWWDALYMTVITVSTVGFQEVQPLHPVGRLFTVGLIVSSVGTVAYVFTTIAQVLTESVLTKFVLGNPMQKQIDRLNGHVIVCGYGRLGQIVVEELHRNGIPVVILERDQAKDGELKQSGHRYLLGSATSDELLDRAGIARARAIVAGTGSDPDNVFITLAAREKRQDLQIHARGETSEAIRRLKQAGADYVLSAYQMGGISLAASIVRPSVARFLEIARPRFGLEVDLEEIRVRAGASLVGKSLRTLEVATAKLRIVALMRNDRIELVPNEDTPVAAGDFLVVIGDRRSLEKLAQLAGDPA